MSDFNRVAKIPGYNMKKHLADSDPHPQYLKNTTADIANAINAYLEDYPITVTGELNSLTDVEIASVSNGQVLVYENGVWKNGTGLEGAVLDVTVNGSSVVNSDHVAVIPNATNTVVGAVRFANANEVSAGSSSNVAVTPAQVNSMINTYKDSAEGGIVVFINMGKWSINGGSTWNNSGTVLTVSPGTYTVTFQAVTGYTTPGSISVTIGKGGVVSINESYTTVTGSIKVTLTPSSAKWSIDGGNVWNASGATVSAEAGVYTVKYNDVSASYNVPEDDTITVVPGVQAVITKTYASATGKVRVVINNAPSGAAWGYSTSSIALPSFSYSAGTIELSPGTYYIHFKSLDGYITPDPVRVTVARGGTADVVVSYRVSSEPIYGVRYYDPATATPIASGNTSTELTGIVVDRDTGNKTLLGTNEPWPVELTAHDFRKCLLKNGAVNYYLNPSDSKKKYSGTYRGKYSSGGTARLTGGDGDVMVEILPVYFRVDFVGVDAVGNSIYDWLISREEFEGSVLHPYFRVGRSSTDDTRAYIQYLGAYESVMCGSNGTPISTDGITTPINYNHTNIGGDTHQVCRSVKGYKPVTNMTLERFRIGHQNAGLHSMNSLAMQFLALMMFIEYRSLNSQEDPNVNDIARGCAGNRSDGFVWYSKSFAYQYVRKTGRADAFGNGTGEVEYDTTTDYTNDSNSLTESFNADATGGKKVVGFTYRGIENPFGHIFKFEDGILTYSGGYYLTDMPSKYTSSTDTAKAAGSGYTTYVHSWPPSGYIQTFEFSEGMPTFFAKTTGGSSTTYLPDYLYNDHGLIMRGGIKYNIVGGVYYGGDTHAGIGSCKKNAASTVSIVAGSRSAFSIVAS